MTSLDPWVPRAIVDEQFRKSGAERWALSRGEFADVLETSVRRAFPEGSPDRRELDRYLASLHIVDLALAAACALGRDVAWDHFVVEHRPVLYRAADALDPSGGARELADSLYADLYGVDGGAERRSLFRYFHGRSSLATWLRAVLAQRHVDALRAQKRIEPLAGDESPIIAPSARASDPDRESLVPLVESALQQAIEDLPARDRLRLRSYYVSQLTLAEIGRISGEHEATVSRHLARTRKDLRATVERQLREHAHLTRDQVARALELALEDPGELNLHEMFDTVEDRKEPPRDRSK